MATKKKGNITSSPEWAKHLRPGVKRWFWKGERNAEDVYQEAEIEGQYIESVEELISDIGNWDCEEKEQYLFVKNCLMLKNKPVSNDVGMAIVVDAVLSKNYFPDGAAKRQYGTKYKYVSLSLCLFE